MTLIQANTVAVTLAICQFAIAQNENSLEKEVRIRLRDFEFRTESITKFGPEVLPVLEKILLDDTTESDHICRVLGVIMELKSDRTRFSPAILAKMSDDNYVVRNMSVQLIGDTGDSRFAQQIVIMLSDSDFTVAVQASVALSKIGDINTVRAMDLWLKRTKFSDKPMSISLKERVTKSRNELVERLKKELK